MSEWCSQATFSCTSTVAAYLSVGGKTGRLLHFLLCIDFLLVLRGRFLRLSQVEYFGPRRLSHSKVVRARFRDVRNRTSSEVCIFRSVTSITSGKVPRVLRICACLIFSSHFRIRFGREMSVNSFSNAMVHGKFLSPIVYQA